LGLQDCDDNQSAKAAESIQYMENIIHQNSKTES